MTGGNPSGYRRKLKAELQGARSAAGLTQREAAQFLDWSESKLIRVENGEVGLSVTDLQAMLRLYGVTDRRVVADLSDAARGSRGSSWWSAFRDVVSPRFAFYLGQEASASSVRVFHPFLIPGLLHTEDYAFELLRVHCSDVEARRIVEMRQQRQQSLFGYPDSPEMTFVVGEEALHRWVGSPAVMRSQLEYLRAAGERPGISVEVIPFGAGAHPGLLGPFILLDFQDPAESLLFVEGLSGELVSRGDEEKISRFANYFEVMRGQALSAGGAGLLIECITDAFRQVGDGAAGGYAHLPDWSLNEMAVTVCQRAHPGEDRWRSSNVVMSGLSESPPRTPVQSLSSSHGQPKTGAGRSASLQAPASYLSSLASSSL